jgi:RNA polymerase sigma-70 factor (ECF subfamily)
MADPFPLYTLLRKSLPAGDAAVRGAPPAEDEAPAVDAAAFERLLMSTVDAARAAWPSFAMSNEVFIPYLARRLPAVSPSALERLRIAELYLTCACVQGDVAAIAAFEAIYLRDVAARLPRPSHGASLEGDVTQAVREKLLVHRAGEPPRIAEYSGRGALASWVQVVAVRTALRMVRGRKRQAELDGRYVLASDTLEDAEVAHLKRRYRVQFAEAFHAALGTLEPRDRNVLRQHYVDGLTMEEIAVVYRVHRITVLRWVERARAALAKETKRRLAGRLGIGKAELDSIIRLIRSQLDVSLRRYLA